MFELDSHTAISNENTQDPEQMPVTILSQNMQPFKINFKNCVITVGNYLEDLILASTTSIENWLYKQMISIAKLKQRIRPNRSYPRVSFKPRSSWTSFGKVARA